MIATTIADVPAPTVPTVAPGTSAATAARQLRETGAPALVVVDDGGVVGIVAPADFLPVVADGDTDATVATVATDPGVVTPDTPAGAAADRMREAGVRRLPVVEAGAPPAVVTAAALASYVPRYRLSDAGAAVEPLRPASQPAADGDGPAVPPARRSEGDGAPTATGSTTQ